MEINLFVRDEAGQLQAIDSPGRLPIVPRIGETICFMRRDVCAKVEAIEYLMPGTSGPARVAIILDRAPTLEQPK